MMRMAEGEPEPAVTLAFADHRDHVGKTGSSPHPRLEVEPIGQRE
jgi:hypothetical protein